MNDLEKRVEKLEEEVVKLNRMYECVETRNGTVWYFCGRCLNTVNKTMIARPTDKKVLCMGEQH